MIDIYHEKTGAHAVRSERAYEAVWKQRGWRRTPPKKTSSASVEETQAPTPPEDPDGWEVHSED